jgi:diaminopimelate decarboxylase
LVRWWRKQGYGIEVVSEFELLAALEEGFAPDNILINGPAKHHWLARHACARLRVNFDSPSELRALLPVAKQFKWSCGIRIQTAQEFSPDTPHYPTQFGFTPNEAVSFLKNSKRNGIILDTVHFHLRTNVRKAEMYERALEQTANICRAAQFRPKHIDCGGGFPPHHVRTPQGELVNADFSLREMARVYKKTLRMFPGAAEIWLENGRWVSARSGVLVSRVLDSKRRGRRRHLICDGGRTLNALISTWEQHEVSFLPVRGGNRIPTTISGPTCMAFDQIARRNLPDSIQPGDYLIWFEAGAYHLPWETRFSHGRAAVYWHDGKTTKRVREKESFEAWWASWGGSGEGKGKSRLCKDFGG